MVHANNANFIYDIIHNKTKTTVLRNIIFIIIFLVIIEQIYRLTKFVYKYNIHYDTGYFLKKVCDTNYIEYETERFHVANNIMNIKISHDNFDTKYDVIFLIFSIVVTLIINYMFVYIFAETAFDNISATVIGLLTPFTGGITAGILPFIQVLGEEFKEFFNNNTVLAVFMMLIKAVCMLYLIFIIPISVIVKLATQHDISILAPNKPDSPFSPNSDKSFSIGNILGHTTILIVIWLFQWSKIYISKFTYNMFFVLFVLFYIIIMGMIDMYQKQKERSSFAITSNKDLNYLDFAYNYFGIKDISTSTFVTWIYNIFGFNNMSIKSKDKYLGPEELKSFNKYLDSLDEKLPIKINTFNIMISIWFFMLIGLIIVYVLLSLKPNGAELYHVFDAGTKDKDILWYFVFIPILFIFVIMFVIIATREYNTLINKNLLYNPTHAYKQKIQEINKIFNQIIENDKATVTNNSICPNTANAIHLVLYSNLFKEYPKSKMFVPKLTYVTACSPNDFFSYTTAEQYNPKTYLDNLFFQNGKCTTVDNELLVAVMKSIIPEYNKILLEADLQKEKEKLETHLKFAISNIMSKKTYDGAKALKFTNEYDYNNAIRDASNLNVDIKNIQIFNTEMLNIINKIAQEYKLAMSELYSTVIKTLTTLCQCNKKQNFTDKGYDVLMNNIDDVINNETNGPYSLNVKKDFVLRYSNIVYELFSKINNILTANIKIDNNNRKLTKFIINNFNNYAKVDSDKHVAKQFHEISEKTTNHLGNNAFKYSDIQELRELLADLHSITSDLHVFLTKDKNYTLLNSKMVELEDKLDNLIVLKKQYTDLYKSKYYNNKDYTIELIYDYKIEYINSNITLHKSIINHIKRTGFYKNFDLVVTSNEFNVDLSVIQTRNEYEAFDIDEYNNKFQTYETLYSNQYDTIFMLVNQLIENHGNNDVIDEAVSNGMQSKAQDTSSLIYGVILVYMIMIILANLVE